MKRVFQKLISIPLILLGLVVMLLAVVGSLGTIGTAVNDLLDKEGAVQIEETPAQGRSAAASPEDVGVNSTAASVGKWSAWVFVLLLFFLVGLFGNFLRGKGVYLWRGGPPAWEQEFEDRKD